MNYAVDWWPDSDADFSAIWLAASDRDAVTRAADQIDRALETNPHAVGTVLFDSVYELILPPLGVEYEVIDSAKSVFVLACWDTATGRPNPTGN